MQSFCFKAEFMYMYHRRTCLKLKTHRKCAVAAGGSVASVQKFGWGAFYKAINE